MNFRESFFNVVPKPAKVIAAVLFVAATADLIVGFVRGHGGHQIHGGHPFRHFFFGIGPLGGCIFAILAVAFVLALGFVYGDARRRNMPAVPWTLIALFVPNLLGFLLYFVLRKPLGAPCPQCGQAMTPEQRFCSWCGYQRAAPMSGGFAPSSGPLSP